MNEQTPNIQTLLPEHIQISSDNAPTDFPQLPAKPAVYVLISTQNVPTLLAATADLRRAVQNRLSAPAELAHRPKVDYRSITGSIRYTIVSSAFAASWWYYRAARKLFPGDWRKMVAWKNAWYIGVNTEEEFPHFNAGQKIVGSPGLDFGPIPGRTLARSVVHALEEMFDLCRYYDILRQAPHGQACAYKQMGKCPAPCDGTITIASYRQQLKTAVEYLCNSGSARIDWNKLIQEQMRQAAAKMEFRIAAALKNKLTEAQLFDSPDMHYADRLDQWGVLSFQYGRTDNWIEPFLIGPGYIESWPQERTRDLSKSCRDWWDKIVGVQSSQIPEDFPRTDILSLACYHFHRSRDAGCYIPLRELNGPDSLEQRINAWLADKRPAEVMEVTSISETNISGSALNEVGDRQENHGAEK
ncbi:MAG TPA: hypothetical protein VMG59_02780 [Phycisphaerae bacterium]|nr:hypothetical protein [Phycisphaerae bacterium]